MALQIMKKDPYFLTQDNGSGSPLHFAVRYCQIDMARPIFPPSPDGFKEREPSPAAQQR